MKPFTCRAFRVCGRPVLTQVTGVNSPAHAAGVPDSPPTRLPHGRRKMICPTMFPAAWMGRIKCQG